MKIVRALLHVRTIGGIAAGYGKAVNSVGVLMPEVEPMELDRAGFVKDEEVVILRRADYESMSDNQQTRGEVGRREKVLDDIFECASCFLCDTHSIQAEVDLV